MPSSSSNDDDDCFGCCCDLLDCCPGDDLNNMGGGNCVADACCCCYDGYDCDNIVCCCVGTSDCLCLRSAHCCACNTKHRGCGMTTDKDAGECCKIGCYCCDYGLIEPKVLCAGADHTLCCYRVRSCPLDPFYLDKCVCAYCFWQCAPECACCASQPDCPALVQLRDGKIEYPKSEEMTR